MFHIGALFPIAPPVTPHYPENNMSKTILATKLYVPLPPPTALARPHLIDRLDASLGGRLTLVCAPAGFGKTTLLSEWLDLCQ